MAKKTNETEEKELTVEEGFEALEEVLLKLEDPDSTLLESFELYKSGITLLKQCNEVIDRVEKQVELLNEDGSLSFFDEEEE